MARSHHRKKHKAHLRQYQQANEGASRIRNRKVTGTFVIIGFVLGIAIGYFASDGVPLWIGGVGVAGALAGWLAGRYFDNESKR